MSKQGNQSQSDLWNKIWYDSHPLGLPLRPISFALKGVVWARRKAYQQGVFSRHSFSVPVIVVGNVTVGGTGKTPFLIWLGKLLQANGIRFGVVSRGYKAQAEPQPCLVGPGSAPEEVGDEPYMIYQQLKCPMAIGSARSEAIELLLQHNKLDVVLSDDGMQHYAMSRDMEIALVDGTRGLGNNYLLPAGPLREPSKRLEEVDFVIANTDAYHDAPVMQLSVDQVSSVCDDSIVCRLSDLKGETVHAVAGIGNPQRFFNTLRDNGVECIEHPKPDHHHFTMEDVRFHDDLPVLMTEKDAVKCRKLGADKLWYVPVEAQLPQALSDELLKAIQHLIQNR